MLKVRIMPTLLYKESGLVKGVKFDSWRRVGALIPAVKVYNMREVDELVFLDITATREHQPPDFDLVDDFADECFMPLTVGGGIRTVEDVRHLLKVGADKVAINTEAVLRPAFIREVATVFGSQCVVAALDAKKRSGHSYEIWTHSGTRPTGIDPVVFAKEMESCGAGEILLTSIDRDGTMEGYDLDLVGSITRAVSIPVIASGGAGTYEHLKQVIMEGGASAVACASIFHFTEQTPLEAKRYLQAQGIHVRM